MRSVRAPSAGAVMWARTDLRRRWLSLVVLGLLAGLAAGLAMASLAGARRSASAFTRLRSTTNGADAVVFPGQVGAVTADWDKLRAEPYVRTVAPWTLLFGTMDGQGGLIFGPLDDQWFQGVDRPIILEGRAFDPNVPTEVVVDQAAAAYGLHLGSTFTYRFYGHDENDIGGGPPHGPTLHMRVVGVVRTTNQFLFTDGLVVPSPALVRDYGSKLYTVENAHVRLRDPATGMRPLTRDVGKLLAPGTPVLDLHRVEARVGTAVTVERTALTMLAIAVAAAGMVFVGQSLVRSVSTIDEDRPTLQSIGLTRHELAAAATLPHIVSAAVATVASGVVAYLLSPRFPIGYSGSIDPDKGFHLDLLVVGIGMVMTLVLVMAGATVPAWRRGRTSAATPGRRSAVAGAARRRAPLPVGLGVTMALEKGRGRRAAPVRPTLAGAVVGVLGIAATLTVNHGLDESLHHPERAGVTWDANFDPSAMTLEEKPPYGVRSSYLRSVLDDPDVADVTLMWRSVVDVGGTGVPALATDPRRGDDVHLVRFDGHEPTGPGQVAIGPATARQLHVRVGDTIVVGGHRLTVVGRALFPVEVHNGFDEGLWVTLPTLRSISPATDPEKGEGVFPSYFLTWKPGTDGEKAVGALQAKLPDQPDVSAAEVPQELGNLRNVRTVPLVLAGFLLFVSISSLLYALAASMRTRRRDVAVLRAIGFTRTMLAATVASHGTTVAVFGLLFGLPLGFAIGRWSWAWVAGRIPLVYVAPLATVLLALVVPAVLIVANVLAAAPARRAARLRPAEVLRTE